MDHYLDLLLAFLGVSRFELAAWILALPFSFWVTRWIVRILEALDA